MQAVYIDIESKCVVGIEPLPAFRTLLESGIAKATGLSVALVSPDEIGDLENVELVETGEHVRLTLGVASHGAASRLRPRRQSYPAGRPPLPQHPVLVPHLLPEQHAMGLVLPGGADLRSGFLGSLRKQPLNPRGILAATELDLAGVRGTHGFGRIPLVLRLRIARDRSSTSAGSITVNFGTDSSLEWFLHGRRQPTERLVTDPVRFAGTRVSSVLFPLAARVPPNVLREDGAVVFYVHLCDTTSRDATGVRPNAHHLLALQDPARSLGVTHLLPSASVRPRS